MKHASLTLRDRSPLVHWGLLIAGSLIVYLNMQGAWLVAAALAATGVYFAFAVSFWAIKQFVEDWWIRFISWNDRWQNWREERAEAKAEREAALAAQQTPGPNQRLFSGSIDANAEEAVEQKKPFRLSSLWARRDKNPVADPVDEIPAFQRAAAQPADAPHVPEITVRRRSNIWERSAVEPAPGAAAPTAVPGPVPRSESVV